MDSRKRFLWLVAAIIFAICMTVYMLSEIVIHPQSTIMGLGGDAGKNYLAYLYHTLFDKGVWYHGMNYPYGEHIVYTDGQALLTVPLSYLNQFMPLKKATVLTVMNLFIGISYVVGVVYIYKTLLQFKVAPWAAIIFAGLIISLSPQVLRVESHYALANMCFLPMLFYWFVRYNDQGGFKYMVYSFLLGSIMSFQHPYFGALMFIWAAMYVAGYWIMYRTDAVKKLKHTIPPVISVLGVYAVITIFMKCTDPVHDRPVYPYGALQTVTDVLHIITSFQSPIWQFIATHAGFLLATEPGEGYMYIGLTATIVFIVSLVIGIKNLVNRKKQNIGSNTEQAFPAIWLFVAFGTLVLALGIPFVWGMEGLFEYLSVLRQFRALGRFGWITYYIVTVYAAVMLYGWYAKALAQKKTARAWAILLVPILVWAGESKAYMKYTRDIAGGGYYRYTTLFSSYQETWEDFLAKSHHTGNDFQAIILLPFIHIGSEKLWVHESESWLVTLGAKAALQLHLPIVNVMMSRTSLSRTEKQVRLIGGPYADKPLLRDMKNNKPFLILHFENDSLDVDQKYLLSASDYIGHYAQGNIYVFYPDRLRASDKKHTDSVLQIAAGMTPGDNCVYTTGSWYINHFDTGTASHKFFGNGAALPAPGDGKQYITRVPVTPAYADEWYEYSTWVLLQASDFRGPEFRLEMTDSAGRILKEEKLFTKESVDNNSMWFRVSGYYKLPANTASVNCRLLDYHFPCYFALDEVMLRPVQSLIISKAKDGKVMANNHLIGVH